MGTRADFYIRNEGNMEWCGSVAFDGYEVDDAVLESTTEDGFRKELSKMLNGRDDATFPSDGWPWPWEDSYTTDYSYIFEHNKVMATNWGYSLYDPLKGEPDTDDSETKLEGYFPNMKAIQNVTFGPRSGVMFITTNPKK